MANSNPFLRAHYEKTVLTEQTRKRVQRIYKQAAQDIERRLKTFQLVNPSDSLKKVYLENLLLEIHKSQYDFNKLIESTIINAGEQAGRIAVEAGNEVMRGAGLIIKGAYSYVPHQQVVKIASGQLYEGKWSLSHSIWKNGLRTQSDIQNVVAKGLAENRPVYDIAKDLEKYVDPSARKPWDWNKVYPGTAKQVDYNAQRLARTMIQHSYQACMVESQRYNPFCKGIVWHSVGLHGRTCETCLDRDGNVFPVKDLPLDHPNGLCYFEPALDNMNDVADRLGDWVNGKSDPGLDNYVAKAFNIDPKSLTGKKAISTVKEKTRKKAAKPGPRLKTKQSTVVNGKDISTTWRRRPNKFDFEIEDVINAQGFDGKPRIVSAKEFDAAVKDSKFIAQRTYSAESQEILEAYRKQLYEGKWYVDCGTGGAQYGQGMYCAADYTGTLSEGIKAEMRHYQELGKTRGFGVAYTETLTLDKSARVITFEDLEKLYGEYSTKYSYDKLIKESLEEVLDELGVVGKEKKQISELMKLYEGATTKKQIARYEELEKALGYGSSGDDPKHSLSALSELRSKRYEKKMEAVVRDRGSFATMLGYDAINAVGHGESGSYTVILNRTKVIIRRP